MGTSKILSVSKRCENCLHFSEGIYGRGHCYVNDETRWYYEQCKDFEYTDEIREAFQGSDLLEE